MEFVTRKDIEAPQEQVFGALIDFSAFERQALRNNIDVTRTSDVPAGLGASWRIRFEFRNRPWTVDARITSFEPNSGYVIRGVSSGIDVEVTVDLLALSRNVTRLSATVTLLPRTLAMRVLVQSLRLVRGRIQAQLDDRIARTARDVQDRWRASS